MNKEIFYKVKVTIPTDPALGISVNIEEGDVGKYITDDDLTGDILLYNPKWNGHSGVKGDLRDKHYWWFKKEDVEYA